jgi:hypothetical protein
VPELQGHNTRTFPPGTVTACHSLENVFYSSCMAGRDARVADRAVRAERRDPAHRYIWIRSGGAWRSGVIVAWFRQGAEWCCWVEHDHPEGRPWPVFQMYVFDPESIRIRDPRAAAPPA